MRRAWSWLICIDAEVHRLRQPRMTFLAMSETWQVRLYVLRALNLLGTDPAGDVSEGDGSMT